MGWYEDFEKDVDDIGDDGFKDNTIGHREGFWHPRNQRDFRNRLEANSAKEEISVVLGDMMI
jgi:hypothetical protein